MLNLVFLNIDSYLYRVQATLLGLNLRIYIVIFGDKRIEISHFLLPNYVCAQEFIGANHGAFLSPIESNKRQLFCGEKNAGAIGGNTF